MLFFLVNEGCGSSHLAMPHACASLCACVCTYVSECACMWGCIGVCVSKGMCVFCTCSVMLAGPVHCPFADNHAHVQ